MTPEMWEQTQEILHQALELQVADRPAFLDRQCGGDRELRAEVESLLETAAEPGALSFIEKAAIQEKTAAAPQLSVGDRLGRYEILREIEGGGMGDVFLGKRISEYEMLVAIKVLKLEMASEGFERRFREERQILARLTHAHIARLLDGGTTEDGRPYFVMEYIDGERIDRYCDRQKLTVHQRIKLFRKVCAAVSFAHSNLVIHRDIKPGNILVGADGEPKLLDFGIAKLREGSSQETSTMAYRTAPGLQPMTVRYACPEQIEPAAITTACDIYSLGVLLYELLTGHYPYRMSNHSMFAYSRAICELEARKPSEVVVGVEEEVRQFSEEVCRLTPEMVSETRSASPRLLRRQLSSDIDCILLKALRKEPERRYSSIEQLSDDLARYLEGLPVMAQKGTSLYNASRFVRRNWLRLSATAALVFFTLIAGYASLQQRNAQRVVQSVADLTEWLLSRSPAAGEEADFAGELREKIEKNVEDQMLAEVLNEIAQDMEDQGGFLTAEIIYREALAMKKRLLGERDGSVALGMNNLAAALEAQGKYEEAEDLYRKALALKREIYPSPDRGIAISLNNLAVLLQNTGRLDEAEELLRESLAMRRELFGPKGAGVAPALNNLGFLLELQKRHGEAEETFREALEIVHDKLGEEHFAAANVLRNLAVVQLSQGDAEAAEASARQAVEIMRDTYGHWRVADAESVLGQCLVEQGRYEEAGVLLERSFPLLRDIKGSNARQTREARERLRTLEDRWSGTTTTP